MSYLTENLYFQSELYNSTSSQINAEKVDNLLAPIVNDSSNWSVAINKANVPISTIPLTVDNIGLRRYAVTISDGTHINTTFVPQINSTKQNFLWDSEGTVIYKRSYTSTGAITTISSVDYAPICGIVAIDRFIVDDFQNVYLTGPTALGSSSDTLYIVGSNNTLLDTGVYSNIVDLYIDRGQKLYVADGGEDQRVFIYFNDNGLNTVSLTQAGVIGANFAGDTFTGLVMVAAGDNQIIVGYDENKLSFYDQNTFEPTHDLTEEIENIVDGVILDSQNAYALVSSSQPADTILGSVAGGAVFNVKSNQQLTSGNTVQSKYAVCPVSYGSSTLQGLTRVSTSNQTWRNASYDPTSQQALTSYITLPTIDNVTANKQTAVAKDNSTDDLRYLNMYAPGVAPPANYWNLRNRNLYVTTPGDVNDMDYNITSDKMFVVDSTNTVSYSDMAVTPVYVWSATANGKVAISPVSFFGSNTSLKATVGREVAVNNIVTVKYDPTSDYMFTLEGAPGSRQINSRNPITGDVILNYPCVASGGIINTFEFSGTQLVVPHGDTSGNVDYYDIATGALTGSLVLTNPGALPMLNSCMVTTSGSLTAYTDAISVVLLQNASNVLTQIFVDSTVIRNGGSVLSLAANELDLVNGLPTLFALIYDDSSTVYLNQFSFTAGYASVSLLRTIKTWDISDAGNIIHIDCIPNMGALFVTQSPGISEVFYQHATTPYSTAAGAFSTYTLGVPVSTATIAYNVSLKGLINWQSFTVDGPIVESIAISKYNPSVGYVVADVDRLIYKVKINYIDKTITYDNPADPTPVSQEQYDFVSTYSTAGETIDSTVTTYNLTTQTQLGSLLFQNVTIPAISKNEISEQFCLIEAGTFKTYTPALVQVVSGTATGLANATCLDVRNGEDLSAGPFSIFDMNQVVAQINDALNECFLRLQSQGTTLTKAPSLTLDFQTGLLTLVYDASYLVPARYIQFNEALFAIAYFSNISGKIILPGPATSLTQSSRTIFNFNDLQSIQFRSNNIFVTGQFFSNNLSSSRIICEIDPDVTTFVNNIGVRLYYDPTILRSFFLNSSLPLQTISISLFYTTKTGKEYQMTLNPNDFFSTKLNFIRKY
jgi:hypothetical protein